MFKSFIEQCLDGDVLIDEIDDFVDQWHSSDLDCSLNEYLGMTEDEYSLWVEKPEALKFIIQAKKNGTDVLSIFSKYKDSNIAARTQDSSSVHEWLVKTGRIKHE